MEFFKEKDGKPLVMNMIETIAQNRAYLSEIDGEIGDGDHGVNMDKGFRLTKNKIENWEVGLSESLTELGTTLLMEVGGSMGPLYGSMFLDMGAEIAGKEKIDAAAFLGMLEAGYAGIKEIGEAKVGDKTLVDTLHPACGAFRSALEANEGFMASLLAMETAAKKGRDSTKALVAKVGRAARLGERSRGVLDAGATSCCLLLCAMSEGAKALLQAT